MISRAFHRAALAALIAIASCAGAGGPASARPFDAAGKAELGRLIESLNQAFLKQDFDKPISMMPHRLLARLAAMGGKSEDAIREEITAQAKVPLESGAVKIISIKFDFAGATFGEGKNGTPYALVPIVSLLELTGRGRVRISESNLAFPEDGKWSVVRVSDLKQILFIKELYPEFADVQFPPAATEFPAK